MLHRLASLLRAPEAKASRTAKLLAFNAGARARWTPRDYAALAREGYLANAIVHGAVRLVAQSAASCRLLVYEGAREKPDHPLAALLARPNPKQDGATLFEALYAHLLLAGNAYVEAIPLGARVRELHALRPDRMKVVPGADGWAEAYEYTVGGRSVRFDQAASSPSPILHLTFFHPLDDHYGLAPLEAAAERARYAQRRRALEQGAARQCRASVRRAGLFGAGRRGAERRAVRAAEARTD
jgi:HK97 family phage portal protein